MTLPPSISVTEFRALVAADVSKRRGKYGNVLCEHNGHTFKSRKERTFYVGLLQRQQAGLVEQIELHPRFAITINGFHVCIVELDFLYVDRKTGLRHYIDVKGRDNAMSRLKRRMVEAQYGFRVEVV